MCKAVQARGCEKAGKPVEIRDFLTAQAHMTEVPLAPFNGYTFNISFHNASGLYSLLHPVLQFVSLHSGDNKLFTAIDERSSDSVVPGWSLGTGTYFIHCETMPKIK